MNGTFKWEGNEVSGKRVLKLYYNDKEFVYSFGTDLTVRTSTAPPVFLIIDFTDAYSQMTKPKITKAVGGLLVMSTTSF